MGIGEWNSDISFSCAMNSWIDKIYRKILPIEHITRLFKQDQPHILDQKFAIDVILTLTNGLILTGQEKVRRQKYINFQDFTLEYKSNKYGAPGEYTKLCTDFYFYGYGSPDNGFSCVYIFSPLKVKLAITNKELQGSLQNNIDHSSASFYAYPFSEFKDDWFIYKKTDLF